MDVLSLRRLLAGQDDATLRMMNTEIVAELRKRQAKREFEAANRIEIGGIYEFDSPKRGDTVLVRVAKINRTSVLAIELDANGKDTVINWRVAPTFLRPVKEAKAA